VSSGRSTDCGSLPEGQRRRAEDDINAKYKEDWFNPEGACGGLVYSPDEAQQQQLYRTGSIELRSSIELDLEPFIEPLQLDDGLIATPPRPVIVPLGVGLGVGREASSSPESPVSPRSPQVGGAVARGARPKKSSKKHRAV